MGKATFDRLLKVAVWEVVASGPFFQGKPPEDGGSCVQCPLTLTSAA